MAVEHNWIKCGLAALAIHVGLLALPVREKVYPVGEQRIIEVVVMRQETPPTSSPRQVERSKPLTRRSVARQAVPRVNRQIPPAPAPKPAEKKDEPPSAGAGNVLDEQIVSQAAPDPGGGEGVGIAGVNVGGGKAGPAAAVRALVRERAERVMARARAVKGGGPVEARFGDADGPQFIYQERPEYPFVDMRLQREGKVIVRLTIDEKGKLQKVDVVEATDQAFAGSAVEGVEAFEIPAGQAKRRIRRLSGALYHTFWLLRVK